MTERKRPRNLGGRIVVMGLFWGIFTYATIAVVGSVFFNLYGAPPAQGQSSGQHEWCLRSLVGLRDDLEAEVMHELGVVVTATQRAVRWPTFQGAWLSEFENAEARCQLDGTMSEAYARLRKLYESYAEVVVRISESRGPASEDLAKLIAELRQR